MKTNKIKTLSIKEARDIISKHHQLIDGEISIFPLNHEFGLNDNKKINENEKIRLLPGQIYSIEYSKNPEKYNLSDLVKYPGFIITKPFYTSLIEKFKESVTGSNINSNKFYENLISVYKFN
jgi:hypothetical protein